LVNRDFTATRPNQLWVVDFTYCPTWSGMAFTAFVSDVFSRRIVGWRIAARMPTELPLDALEMALWIRERAGQPAGKGLIHHSDSEYGSAGAPGRPDPHSDGRARMAGAGVLPSVLTHTPIDAAVFPRDLSVAWEHPGEALASPTV
jgi:putative transposase